MNVSRVVKPPASPVMARLVRTMTNKPHWHDVRIAILARMGLSPRMTGET
jgi:hypothetical protein